MAPTPLAAQMMEGSNNGNPTYVDYDEFLEQLWKPRINAFEFQVDGIIFQIRSIPEEPGVRLFVEAEIGYMPFTAESAARRKMLKKILESTVRLQTAKFILGEKGKITMDGDIRIAPIDSPEVNFARLIILIQQVKPYIYLLGRYL